MPFNDQILNGNQVWVDPSGRGIWQVPPGFTPETSPFNPGNPFYGIPAGEQPFSSAYTGNAVDPNSLNAAGATSQPIPATTQAMGQMPAQTWTMTLPTTGSTATGSRPIGVPGNDLNNMTAPNVPLSSPGTQGMDSGSVPARTWTQSATVPYGRVPETNTQSDPFSDLFGLGPLPTIPDIQLGSMPQMSGQLDPDFLKQYQQNMLNTQGNISDIYSGMNLPQAQAAQFDLNSLPQLQATQLDQSPAMQQLLSGQGFDPATMAKLNAGAVDTINQQAGANRGSAKLALQEAGLSNSPAQAAMLSQIDRQRGDQATQTLNQLAVQNADRGLQNFQMGAQMDFSREQGNMAAANSMALARAQQMLTAMNTNVSNMQATNMANFGAQTNRTMEGAGRQADVAAQSGSQLGSASLQNQQTANQQNAGNAFNWQLNQAQLDRQRDLANSNMQQSMTQTGINGLLGLAGMQQPTTLTGQANNLLGQVNPTSMLGSVLSNIGQANTQVTPTRTTG